MNETGGPSPEQMGVGAEPTKKIPTLDEYAEIINPNQRPEGALERRFRG